jgi:hypothetical protein
MRCESGAAAERDVLGKPDGAHAALADLLEDSVRPDLRASSIRQIPWHEISGRTVVASQLKARTWT